MFYANFWTNRTSALYPDREQRVKRRSVLLDTLPINTYPSI